MRKKTDKKDDKDRHSQEKYLVAVTSCPTGIAHTYMAADSLINKGKELGIPVHVEAQGSGHIDRLDSALIAAAAGVIFAHDVSIQMPERFEHLPVVDVGVKAAINNPGKLISEVMAKKKDPNARSNPVAQPAEPAKTLNWGQRIQKAVMAGVSYMIPFVAAGGLLIALGFLIGGYDVAGLAQDISLNFSLWNLPSNGPFEGNIITSRAGFPLYLGALLTYLGQTGMSFLVPALSGYIAFGLAGRPGIAPGFIGGSNLGSARSWLYRRAGDWDYRRSYRQLAIYLKCPRWLAGLMPVAIVPLVASLLMGLLMLLLLGRPLAALMSALQKWLNSMGGSSAILLGIVIGLMMCFDLGGPVKQSSLPGGYGGIVPSHWRCL